MTTQLTLDGDSDPYTDPETLREYYHGKGMTLREVGSRLGCGHTTVYRHMVKYGIERR
jgi:transposase